MFLLGIVGILLLVIVLSDIFETIVMPRRVTARIRLTRVFYRLTWAPWAAFARRMTGQTREGYVSIYGPLSLLLLLVTWAAGLILGYSLVFWGFGVPLRSALGGTGYDTYLYMSGTTFLTLGLGDVLPHTPLGRLLTVLEAGNGFGVLAVVIGYLPVLYQAFSRREVNVTLLDARAGSPPSAGEMLLRYGQAENAANFSRFLRDWERWAAELMESHLSYPILAYYRSQHENQSWLAALTSILDLATLIMAGVGELDRRPALLAYATARHAAVDLCRVLGLEPRPPAMDRLPPEQLDELRTSLAAAGVVLRADPAAVQKLTKLRSMYEPYVNAMSQYLTIPLPPWTSTEATREYWRTVAI